jgi:hypothetical protein
MVLEFFHAYTERERERERDRESERFLYGLRRDANKRNTVYACSRSL